jgi:hypothetical protein
VIRTTLRRHRRRVRPLLGALLVMSATTVVAVLGPAAASAARQATVCPSGCTHTTIASALAAADRGARITVAPGTYAGGFTISKDVTLKGAGAGQTIVSGGAPVIVVAAGVDAELRGITVSGGGGDGSDRGAGIRNAGDLTVKDSTIEGNVASGVFQGFGGGIYNEASGELRVVDSTIRENVAASGFGGGIYNEGQATVRGSAIVANIADVGAGVYGGPGGADTDIVGSRIADNVGGSGGGGLAGDDLEVSASFVTGNSAAIGGGISGRAVIRGTVVSDNRAFVFGGGISATGPVDLHRSVVTRNSAVNDGGGVYVWSTGSLERRGSIITGNTPQDCIGC